MDNNPKLLCRVGLGDLLKRKLCVIWSRHCDWPLLHTILIVVSSGCDYFSFLTPLQYFVKVAVYLRPNRVKKLTKSRMSLNWKRRP
jgi:hypothetical protein